WVGQTYVLMPNGGQKRRTVYGRTRDDVLTKLTKLRALTLQGVPAPDGRVTLAQYLPQWLDEVAARKVRPRTVELYRMVIDRHILPTLGRKRLDRLTPVDIRQLLAAK